MGHINNVNTCITPLMGWFKEELVGQNIRKIQPKIWAENHDDHLRAYFETLE